MPKRYLVRGWFDHCGAYCLAYREEERRRVSCLVEGLMELIER
jgi:hypothetical protein